MANSYALEVHFDGETKIHVISYNTPWKDLEAMLKCDLDLEDIVVKYIDEEDDVVSVNGVCSHVLNGTSDRVNVNSQEEFEEALKVARTCGDTLQIEVECPAKTTAPVSVTPTPRTTNIKQTKPQDTAGSKLKAGEKARLVRQAKLKRKANHYSSLAGEAGSARPKMSATERQQRAALQGQGPPGQGPGVVGVRAKPSDQAEEAPEAPFSEPPSKWLKTKWLKQEVSKIVPDIVNGVLNGLNEAAAKTSCTKTHEKLPGDQAPPTNQIEHKGDEKVRHEGIECDNCDKIICGIRYKCGNCTNYDLCENCEGVAGVHDHNHVFLKLRWPVRHSMFGALLKRVVYNFTSFPSATKPCACDWEAASYFYPSRKYGFSTGPSRSTPIPIGFYDAEFIRDMNMADGTHVQPDTNLKKMWVVKNTGTAQWDSHVTLKLLWGNMLSPLEVKVPPTRPGETCTLTVDLMTPQALGQAESHWQLFVGHEFGDRIWCRVVVDPAEILEPSSTGPPYLQKIQVVGGKSEDDSSNLPSPPPHSPVEEQSGPGGPGGREWPVSGARPSRHAVHLLSLAPPAAGHGATPPDPLPPPLPPLVLTASSVAKEAAAPPPAQGVPPPPPSAGVEGVPPPPPAEVEGGVSRQASEEAFSPRDLLAFEMLSISDFGTPNNTPIDGTPRMSPLHEKMVQAKLTRDMELFEVVEAPIIEESSVERRAEQDISLKLQELKQAGPIWPPAAAAALLPAPAQGEAPTAVGGGEGKDSEEELEDTFIVVPLPDCFKTEIPLDQSTRSQQDPSPPMYSSLLSMSFNARSSSSEEDEFEHLEEDEAEEEENDEPLEEDLCPPDLPSWMQRAVQADTEPAPLIPLTSDPADPVTLATSRGVAVATQRLLPSDFVEEEEVRADRESPVQGEVFSDAMAYPPATAPMPIPPRIPPPPLPPSRPKSRQREEVVSSPTLPAEEDEPQPPTTPYQQALLAMNNGSSAPGTSHNHGPTDYGNNDETFDPLGYAGGLVNQAWNAASVTANSVVTALFAKNQHYVPPSSSWPPEGGRPPVTPMVQLFDMGFCDRQLNQRLLAKHHHNLQAVVQDLVHNYSDGNWHLSRH